MPRPFHGNIGVGNLQSESENTTERGHYPLELFDVALDLSESIDVRFAESNLLPLRPARARDEYPK